LEQALQPKLSRKWESASTGPEPEYLLASMRPGLELALPLAPEFALPVREWTVRWPEWGAEWESARLAAHPDQFACLE
jgi:hypothetical protein